MQGYFLLCSQHSHFRNILHTFVTLDTILPFLVDRWRAAGAAGRPGGAALPRGAGSPGIGAGSGIPPNLYGITWSPTPTQSLLHAV
jgi:hypothetical protein